MSALLSRRSVLLSSAASIAMLQLQSGLLLSVIPYQEAKASGLTLANVVEFWQGTTTKLSSVLYADAKTLFNAPVSPLTTATVFGQFNIQLTQAMSATYPGGMTVASLTAPDGSDRFVVSLLPPSVVIPGSSLGYNPSLHVYAALDSAQSHFASFVIPNIITLPSDGAGHLLSAPHMVQFSLGIIPGTTPARFMLQAVAFNQATGKFKIGAGIPTNPSGTVPLADQTPPLAFDIPVQMAAPGSSLIFSMGLPLEAGYKPIGGFMSMYDALSARMAKTWFNFNNPGNVDLSQTLPLTLNLLGASAQTNLTQAIGAAGTKASVAYEIMYQLTIALQSSTATAAAKATADLSAAIGNAQSKLAQGTAYLQAKNNLIVAQQYANAASVSLKFGITATTTQNALLALAESESALANALSTAPASPSTQVLSSTTDTVTNITTTTGSTPQVVLDGNASMITMPNGDVVPASSSSYSENQVNGAIMYSNAGQQPTQPETCPCVDVEILNLTPPPN